MASLRILRNKYYVRIWVDGKEKILPTGTSNRREAEQQLKRIQREEIEIKQKLRTELSDFSKRLTINDGIHYFLKNVKREKNLRESTIVSYQKSCNDFKSAYKQLVYFDNLTKTHYSKLLDYLEKRYNPTTVNIRLRSIKAMLNYLADNDMIKSLPFSIKQVKVDAVLPKFLKPEELECIYSNTKNGKLIATFKVLAGTGMRVGELAYSKRDGGFLKITQSKGRKQRLVPLQDSLYDFYDQATQNPYSPGFISRSFTAACRYCGISGKTVHSLRHTFALRKLLELNNLKLVMELLGHSSTKVTEIYTQIPTDYLQQIFVDRQSKAGKAKQSDN